jgi:hypothetical protein
MKASQANVSASHTGRGDCGKEETLMTLDTHNTPETIAATKHNNDTHYITGSGEYGCLYDSCGVYKTLSLAVDGLGETFDLGRTRKAKLKRYRHLDLNPGRDGADYCEITTCNCNDPWIHDEQITEDDWNC